MLRAGLHWVLALVSGGWCCRRRKSMLDNSPLRELLRVHVDFDGIRRSIARGHLRAFALCATSYTAAIRSPSLTASIRSTSGPACSASARARS